MTDKYLTEAVTTLRDLFMTGEFDSKAAQLLQQIKKAQLNIKEVKLYEEEGKLNNIFRDLRAPMGVSGRMFFNLYIWGIGPGIAALKSELNNAMKVCELSHISFGHYNDSDSFYDDFKEEIKKTQEYLEMFDKLNRHFKELYTDRVDRIDMEDIVVRTIYNQYKNIAMDLEINSKSFSMSQYSRILNAIDVYYQILITLSRFAASQHQISRILFNSAEKDKRIAIESKLSSRFNYIDLFMKYEANDSYDPLKREDTVEEAYNTDFKGLVKLVNRMDKLHPEVFGYEEKLTWIEYMRLLLQDKNAVGDNMLRIAMSSVDSSLDGSGDMLRQKKIELPPGSSNKSPLEQAEEYLEHSLDKIVQRSIDEAEGDDIVYEEVIKPLVDDRDKDKEKRHFMPPGGKSRGDGKVERTEIPMVKSIDGFREYLVGNYAKARRRFNSDTLYYENRKSSDGVIIPHRRREDSIARNKFIVLVDVSSSMANETVSLIIESIKELAGNDSDIDTDESRLIQWTTELMSDTTWDEIELSTVTGGTNIALGMQYCLQYLTGGDHLVVISDFEDALNYWYKFMEEHQEINYRGVLVIGPDSLYNFKGVKLPDLAALELFMDIVIYGGILLR
jgi:hypothetical protein